eukprot:GHVH01001037.1.p1 GENE.GHVH01001037.1~~GHVH01001037.1.p1  ORF type:complete len:1120 (-),score=169.39 GHVH01001037.1:1491-4850(-)
MPTSKQKLARRRDTATVLCEELIDMVQRHGIEFHHTKDVIESIQLELKWWEQEANKALKEERIEAFEEIFAITDKLNGTLEEAKGYKPPPKVTGASEGSLPGLPIGDETRKMIEAMENQYSNKVMSPKNSSGFSFGQGESFGLQQKFGSVENSQNEPADSRSSSESSNKRPVKLKKRKSRKHRIQSEEEEPMDSVVSPNMRSLPTSNHRIPREPIQIYISNLEGLPSFAGRIYISISTAYESPTHGMFGETVATKTALLDAAGGRATWDELYTIPWPSTDDSALDHACFLCFNVLCPILTNPTPVLLASGYVPMFPPAALQESIVEHPSNVKLTVHEGSTVNAFGPDLADVTSRDLIINFRLPPNFYKTSPPPSMNVNHGGSAFNTVFQSPAHIQYLQHHKMDSRISPDHVPRPTTSTFNGYPQNSPYGSMSGFMIGGGFALPSLPDGVSIPEGIEDTPTVRALVVLNGNIKADLDNSKSLLEESKLETEKLRRELKLKQSQIAIFSAQNADLETCEHKLEEISTKYSIAEKTIAQLRDTLESSRGRVKELENEVDAARTTIKRNEFNLQGSRLDLISQKRKMKHVVDDLSQVPSWLNQADEREETHYDPQKDLEASIRYQAMSDVPTKSAARGTGLASAWAPRARAREGRPMPRVSTARDDVLPNKDAMQLLARIDHIDTWISSNKIDSVARMQEQENRSLQPSSHHKPRSSYHSVPHVTKIQPSLTPIRGTYRRAGIDSRPLTARAGTLLAEPNLVVALLEPADGEADHDLIVIFSKAPSEQLTCSLKGASTSAGAYLVLSEMPSPLTGQDLPPTPPNLPNRMIYELKYHNNCARTWLSPGFSRIDIDINMDDGGSHACSIVLPVTPFMFGVAPISNDNGVGSERAIQSSQWMNVSRMLSSDSDILKRILRDFDAICGLSCHTYPQSMSGSQNVPQDTLLYSGGALCSCTTELSFANCALFRDSDRGLSSLCSLVKRRGLARSLSAFHHREGPTSRWRCLLIGCDSGFPADKRNLRERIESGAGDLVFIELAEVINANMISVTMAAATTEQLTEMNDYLCEVLLYSAALPSASPAKPVVANRHHCGKLAEVQVDRSKVLGITSDQNEPNSYWLRHEV